MNTLRLLPITCAAALLGAACGMDPEPYLDADFALEREVVSEGLLAFVNNPATDVETLDNYVGIDTRAARNIIATRGSSSLFQTLGQLDAVPYVGPATLDKLTSFARQIGFIPAGLPGTFDAVSFDARQAVEAVEIANLATDAQLKSIGLDARQAGNIVAARPIASAYHLSTVAYVGTASMTKIRDFVETWTGQKLLGDGALFDGLPFGPVDQEIGLEIVNHASDEDLVVVGGLYQYGAKLTVANRPYASLSAWSNLRGIGRGTVEQLLGYVRSGRWARISSEPAPAPAPSPLTVTAADIPGIVRDAVAAKGDVYLSYVAEVCGDYHSYYPTAKGDACHQHCLSACAGAITPYLEAGLSGWGWIGKTFDTRAAAVEQAAQIIVSAGYGPADSCGEIEYLGCMDN